MLGKEALNRCVLSFWWNSWSEEAEVTSAGSWFQSIGAATGNEWLSIVDSPWAGTISWVVAEDRIIIRQHSVISFVCHRSQCFLRWRICSDWIKVWLVLFNSKSWPSTEVKLSPSMVMLMTTDSISAKSTVNVDWFLPISSSQLLRTSYLRWWVETAWF